MNITHRQIDKIFELIHDKYNIKMLIIDSQRLTFRWHDGTLKRFDSDFNGIMKAVDWIEHAKAEEEVRFQEKRLREVFYP